MKCPHCGKDTDDHLAVETGDNPLWERSILQATLRLGSYAPPFVRDTVHSSEQMARPRWYKVCDGCNRVSCDGCNTLVEELVEE